MYLCRSCLEIKGYPGPVTHIWNLSLFVRNGSADRQLLTGQHEKGLNILFLSAYTSWNVDYAAWLQSSYTVLLKSIQYLGCNFAVSQSTSNDTFLLVNVLCTYSITHLSHLLNHVLSPKIGIVTYSVSLAFGLLSNQATFMVLTLS